MVDDPKRVHTDLAIEFTGMAFDVLAYFLEKPIGNLGSNGL
jgi:hypothetical protein